MKNLKNKKGFTLIELIVVIAILGILALFLVPQFMGYSQDAKKQVLQANARTVWSAANNALTQSEYDENITVSDGGIATTALEKLGESFKKAGIVVTVDVADDGKSITSVTYTEDSKACTYNGKTFSGDC